MSSRPKKRRLNCLTIFLLFSLTSCIILTAAGFLFETFATNRAFQRHPPPGQLIEVGEYRLHLEIQGENTGLPTVILDSGAMSFSAQWGWVMGSLGRFTQVVAYDRPGMGWSEPSPSQLEADELVQHLRLALQSAGVEGPYILVGHSMGGLITRLFAQIYPTEVVGLVQIDPRVLDWNSPTESEIRLQTTILSVLSRLGVVRLSGVATRDTQGLPPPFYQQAVDITASYKHLGNTGSEAYLGESATALLLQGEDLSRFPLIVLTAPEPDGAISSPQREALNEQHAQLAALSPEGEHLIVHGASHITIVTHENYAQSITNAILELLGLRD